MLMGIKNLKKSNCFRGFANATSWFFEAIDGISGTSWPVIGPIWS